MKLLIESDDVRNILCHHAHNLNTAHRYNRIELVDEGVLLSYVAPEVPVYLTPTRWERIKIRLGLMRSPEPAGHWEPVDWSSQFSGPLAPAVTALRRFAATVGGGK